MPEPQSGPGALYSEYSIAGTNGMKLKEAGEDTWTAARAGTAGFCIVPGRA